MSKEFRKEVADTFRGIKDDFERSLAPPKPDGSGGGRHQLDKSVVEQVRSDIDRLIEKNVGDGSGKASPREWGIWHAAAGSDGRDE